MIETMRIVRDVNLGAILCTHGAAVKIDSVTDVRRGQGATNLVFPASSIERVRVPQSMDKPTLVDKSLLLAIQDGTLAQVDPHHTAVDCVRTLVNRQRILKWLQDGKPMLLVRDGDSQRAVYRPCDALPTHVLNFPVQFKCHDLKIAAALATLGVQICRITGSHGNHVFYLTATPIVEGVPKFDAIPIIQAEKSGELTEHPFCFGMQVQRNKAKLEQMLTGKRPELYITKLGTQKGTSALLPQIDNKKLMDRRLDQARTHCGGF